VVPGLFEYGSCKRRKGDDEGKEEDGSKVGEEGGPFDDAKVKELGQAVVVWRGLEPTRTGTSQKLAV
jgi:hypothetical protein